MIILVTGTSSGFGAEIRRHLQMAGHTVYGSSRKAVADDPYMLHFDVTNYNAVKSGVETVIEREGHIDVLINNAGMGIGGAAELATEDEVRRQIDTNFIGMTNLCRAVLPTMRANRSGRVINISSVAGRFAVPFQGLYSASKFAIEGYSQALQLETFPLGIKVICVNPGDFNTGFTKARLISQPTMECTDYNVSFRRVLKNIEHDEQHGGTPDMLARKIVKIVASRHPRFHYVVAKDPIQPFAVYMSAILPKRFFFRLVRMFYNC